MSEGRIADLLFDASMDLSVGCEGCARYECLRACLSIGLLKIAGVHLPDGLVFFSLMDEKGTRRFECLLTVVDVAAMHLSVDLANEHFGPSGIQRHIIYERERYIKRQID